MKTTRTALLALCMVAGVASPGGAAPDPASTARDLGGCVLSEATIGDPQEVFQGIAAECRLQLPLVQDWIANIELRGDTAECVEVIPARLADEAPAYEVRTLLPRLGERGPRANGPDLVVVSEVGGQPQNGGGAIGLLVHTGRGRLIAVDFSRGQHGPKSYIFAHFTADRDEAALDPGCKPLA